MMPALAVLLGMQCWGQLLAQLYHADTVVHGVESVLCNNKSIKAKKAMDRRSYKQ